MMTGAEKQDVVIFNLFPDEFESLLAGNIGILQQAQKCIRHL